MFSEFQNGLGQISGRLSGIRNCRISGIRPNPNGYILYVGKCRSSEVWGDVGNVWGIPKWPWGYEEGGVDYFQVLQN